MGRVFLVGPRASGKTTIGGMLAEALGTPFLDADGILQREAGESVAGIVAREGWEGFRLREAATLADIVSKGPADAVVATGGGIVLNEGNRRLMRASGRVFFLDVPPEELRRRLGADPLAAQRPPLAGGDPVDEVALVLAERLPLYRAACHHAVDGAAPAEAVCLRIRELLARPAPRGPDGPRGAGRKKVSRLRDDLRKTH
ncbi:MAG: shikimate kinase AroL [Desulfovibrio sp.]|jgi:shikimate kinase|nr:shikimate kinase AroL [Desulfovibrio sp.]